MPSRRISQMSASRSRRRDRLEPSAWLVMLIAGLVWIHVCRIGEASNPGPQQHPLDDPDDWHDLEEWCDDFGEEVFG